jgi:hypothetical protein
VVQALCALKGQRFETEGAFLRAVEQPLGAEALGQYRALLLKLGEGAGKFNAAAYEALQPSGRAVSSGARRALDGPSLTGILTGVQSD